MEVSMLSYLTTADVRAQKVIVDALRTEFPDMTLVGEEDEDDEGANSGPLADYASWCPEPLEVAAEVPAEFSAAHLYEPCAGWASRVLAGLGRC